MNAYRHTICTHKESMREREKEKKKKGGKKERVEDGGRGGGINPKGSERIIGNTDLERGTDIIVTY